MRKRQPRGCLFHSLFATGPYRLSLDNLGKDDSSAYEANYIQKKTNRLMAVKKQPQNNKKKPLESITCIEALAVKFIAAS